MTPPEQSPKCKLHVIRQTTVSAAKNRLSVKVTFLMSVTGYIFQNSCKSQQSHSNQKIRRLRMTVNIEKSKVKMKKMYLVAQSFCCHGNVTEN